MQSSARHKLLSIVVSLLAAFLMVGGLAGCTSGAGLAIYQDDISNRAGHRTDNIDQQRVVDRVEQIASGYFDRFSVEANQLATRSRSFCEGVIELQEVQQSWSSAAQAWVALQTFRFAPVANLEKRWSFSYWPDKSGLVDKQVARDLLALPVDKITTSYVGKSSVVLQGLTAMEYLLFVTLPDFSAVNGNRSACAALIAVSAYFSLQADTLLKEWQDRLALEGINFEDLVISLARTVRMVRVDKIGSPLGLTSSQQNHTFAEAWRSEQSLSLIKHNLIVIESLFMGDISNQIEGSQDGHVGDVRNTSLDLYLRDTLEQGVLAQQIAIQLELLKQLHEETGDAFLSEWATARGQKRLYIIYEQWIALEQLIAQRLPAVLGVFIGFNEADGD